MMPVAISGRMSAIAAFAVGPAFPVWSDGPLALVVSWFEGLVPPEDPGDAITCSSSPFATGRLPDTLSISDGATAPDTAR